MKRITCTILGILCASISFLITQNLPANQLQLSEISTGVEVDERGPRIGKQEGYLNQDAILTSSYSNDNELSCTIAWQDAVFGACIGRDNNMIAHDVDGDGVEEIITSFYHSQNFEKGWYIVKYNALLNEYENFYVSKIYERKISNLKLLDLDGDGYEESLAISSVEVIDIFSFNSMRIEQTIDIPSFYTLGAVGVDYLDMNGDGTAELIAASYGEVVIINEAMTEVLHHFDMLSNGDSEIGNVDEDDQLEMVFANGTVLSFSPDWMLNYEYDFRPDVSSSSSDDVVELSDIDGDGKDEVIFNDFWRSILIYDAEIETLRLEIETNSNITAFRMHDIDDDGREEILYGDGQFDGSIYCMDPVSGMEIWSFQSPEYYILGLVAGDFDGDNDDEVAWSSSCGSSSPGRFYIYNQNSSTYEWENRTIEGPFYAIEIEDIDNDGEKEIISLSSSSGDDNRSGVLSVYDAISKSIKYRSPPHYFQDLEYGMQAMMITDHGEDGDIDIVIACGSSDAGRILVIDGTTYEVEEDHLFEAEYDGTFNTITAADLDLDGNEEWIASDGFRLNLIDPVTFQIIWEGPDIPTGAGAHRVLAGNLDSDEELEIIFHDDRIYRYEDASLTQTFTDSRDYTAVHLYDWDGDGEMEILAGNEDGEVELLDGDLTLMGEFYDTGESDEINGIRNIDINNDGVDEFMITTEFFVHFIDRAGNRVVSQVLGREVGKRNGIAITDYDQDGFPNVFIGSKLAVMELSLDCAICLFQEVNYTLVEPSCGQNNGQLILQNFNPQGETYLNGESLDQGTVSDLAPGDYTLVVIDENGCEKIEEFTFEKTIGANIRVEISDRSCEGESDGSIEILVNGAVSPLSFLWENGNTTNELVGLEPGIYQCTITEGNGCEYILSPDVVLDSVFILLRSHSNIGTCEGLDNGLAIPTFLSSEWPYTVYWDGVEGGRSHDSLALGAHEIAVVDASGCRDTLTFITEEYPLLVSTSSQDTACNIQADALVLTSAVQGVPPYQYHWSDNIHTGTFLYLPAGWHSVTVSDGRDCQTVDSIFIPSHPLEFVVETQDLTCFDGEDGQAIVSVTEGTGPFTYTWEDQQMGAIRNDFNRGSHFITVGDSFGCNRTEEVVLQSPMALIAEFSATPDSPLTPDIREGSITVTVMGGTSPYTYLWINDGTNPTINGLPNGAYDLEITDANGCTLDTIFNLVAPILPPHSGADAYVYPIPTLDDVIIQLGAEKGLIEVSKIRLYNAAGQLVEQLGTGQVSRISDDKIVIDLSKHPSGTYQIVIDYLEVPGGITHPRRLVRKLQRF